MSENGQRFRHELKYEVSLEQAEEFFREILPFCEYDKHAGETNSYEISSVYYDTSDLRFYTDREESIGYRRKIRLRAYVTGQQTTALFLEVKEKHKQYVSKKRLFLKDHSILDCGIVHNRIPLSLIIDQLEDTAEAREFAYLSKRLNLVPVVMIRYIRKALIPTFDHDMRITLDTKITAGGDYLHQYDADLEKNVIKAGSGVLEIKTNQGIPLWLFSIMKRFSLVQTRYSKYCLGVEAIYGRSKPWLALTEELPKTEIEYEIRDEKAA